VTVGESPRKVPPLACRADHWRKKQPMVVEEEPRKNTSTDGPPLLRRRRGMKPPGSAGVPPAHVLAQPLPSQRPGSTGNGARTLLRPSPWRFRRQSGRVPHRRETEWHRTGVHAGGTPALPGGFIPSLLLLKGARAGLPGRSPCRCGRAVTPSGPSCHFVDHSFFVCFGQERLVNPANKRNQHKGSDILSLFPPFYLQDSTFCSRHL